jgi:HDOD domain
MHPYFEQNLNSVARGTDGMVAAGEPVQFDSLAHARCSRILPVLPLTLAQLELLIQEAVVDLGAIVEVARPDASLTAQLLLLANRDRDEDDRLSRVADCVVQLGISAVRDLVRGMSPIGPSDWRSRALLTHSRVAAQAAQAIALQVPGVDPEEAYVGGLLHLFPEFIALQESTAEKRVISAAWDDCHFPRFVSDVICWCRHPFAAPGPESLLCQVVLAACESVGQLSARPTTDRHDHVGSLGVRCADRGE